MEQAGGWLRMFFEQIELQNYNVLQFEKKQNKHDQLNHHPTYLWVGQNNTG